jgi:hypothetical protein
LRSLYKTLIYPTVAPVSVAQFKRWITIDPNVTLNDEKYAAAISSSVDMFEKQSGMKMSYQRMRWNPWRFGNQYYGSCAGREMRVSFGNTDDVEISYIDTDGASQTFTDFTVLADENGNSRIVLDREKEWPDVDSESEYPITIDFDCGHPVGTDWTANTVYATGYKMRPTWIRAHSLVYEATPGGTSGATEPFLTGETGATEAEGADTLIWLCLGKTIPEVAETAILSMATHLIEKQGIMLDYPNMNLMQANWERGVSLTKLRW